MKSSEYYFLELLKAGLWERVTILEGKGPIAFDKVYQLAQEQSVVGVLASGLEFVRNRHFKKQEVISFVKQVYSIERKNVEMNDFLITLFNWMNENGIFAVLVKGQSVARKYQRPLWRVSGDIDLLLEKDQYIKALKFFSEKCVCTEKEDIYKKHIAFRADSFALELHGSFRTGIDARLDREMDVIYDDVFSNSTFESWQYKGVSIPVLAPHQEVIHLFVHIQKHFFKGGIGLRQICDWCRALWVSREEIDSTRLRLDLKRLGLFSEWEVFTSLAVDYLGMPQEAMPLYNHNKKSQAGIILKRILVFGNFGGNRDVSYRSRIKSSFFRKTFTLFRQALDNLYVVRVFPLDAFRFLYGFSRFRIFRPKN